MNPRAIWVVFRFEASRTMTPVRLAVAAALALFPAALLLLTKQQADFLDRHENAALALFDSDSRAALRHEPAAVSRSRRIRRAGGQNMDLSHDQSVGQGIHSVGQVLNRRGDDGDHSLDEPRTVPGRRAT